MFEPYANFFYLAAYFVIFSFAWWIIDSSYKSYSYKKFTNWGFMYWPRCPIYGFPIVIMIIFINFFKENIIAFFFAALVIITIWEYIIWWFLETVFHKKFWDYSDEKFNYKWRICLKSSLTWWVLSVVFVLFIYHPVSNFVTSIPLAWLVRILGLIYAILLSDFTISLIRHITDRIDKKLVEEKLI